MLDLIDEVSGIFQLTIQIGNFGGKFVADKDRHYLFPSYGNLA